MLNFGAVAQHDGAQITGGVGANNVALEATFDQVGNVAAVVDVGMGQNQDVYFAGIVGQFLVARIAFFARTLVQATV